MSLAKGTLNLAIVLTVSTEIQFSLVFSEISKLTVIV